MSLRDLIVTWLRAFVGGGSLTNGDFVETMNALSRAIARIDRKRSALADERMRLAGWRDRIRAEMREKREHLHDNIVD